MFVEWDFTPVAHAYKRANIESAKRADDEVIKIVKRWMKVLTVEPGPSRRQDLVQPLKSFFGGFLMFVACPRLQSHLHVRGAAHLAAASHAAAYFQLLCWKNERETSLIHRLDTRLILHRGDSRRKLVIRTSLTRELSRVYHSWFKHRTNLLLFSLLTSLSRLFCSIAESNIIVLETIIRRYFCVIDCDFDKIYFFIVSYGLRDEIECYKCLYVTV